jgi:glycosyltransferase involved in cell wall biosynthesis
MNGSRIVFVSYRHSVHADHSGYDRIVERIPGTIIDSSLIEQGTRWLPDRVFGWLRRASGLERYNRPRALLELRAAFPFLSGSKKVFHFIYGDYGYRYLGALPNWRGHKLVASFHLPPTVLEATLHEPRHLARLDRVILLGESQRRFFGNWVDETRIRVVPYGVDTEFFSPGEAGRDPLHCLFVGTYLRDFELFRTAVRLLVREMPELRVTVVTRSDSVAEFRALPNTDVRTGLSDEELRALYRAATLLLLPLEDAVANNTILEAMACGLPIVTTDVGSVRDYVRDDAGAVVPRGDVAELARITFDWLNDSDLRGRASEAARRLAQTEFSFDHIARRIQQLLEELLE